MTELERYQQWCEQAPLNEAGRAALAAMQNDETERKGCFGAELQFGTAGIRGIMGIGTNRLNDFTVRRTAQGLAAWLTSTELPQRCAIGYDSRHNSRRYAEGDFDIRMNDYGRDDELGELAASFNNMAENLQQTERQRREFITNISHELKTPMTTIAGYTDGILDGTIPPENERQYLQIISDESRRLSRLVRRMLDVSQLQAIDPLREGKHFDICESMRRVLISMERKITDRNLDVEADIPEEPILVLGDKDMITQVIYNLLENATKFAREGSTLYLGVTTIDGKARVTVRNEGDTIPAEELPLLFERFHKSDKSRSEDKDGYGLGLYIVKTILEQHKEKISVTSEDGVTAFSFSLATE